MTLDDLIADGAAAIVSILRGIREDEIEDVAAALVEAGISIIEVPLNSPRPLASIRRLVDRFGESALCGAGTVTSVADVREVASVGGRLIVTPNTDQRVISEALSLGLEVVPGCQTPTEAFTAIAAGARRIKLFPAGTLGPNHLRPLRDVLPDGTGIWAVGGTDRNSLRDWLSSGAEGIGVGSALYRKGDGRQDVGPRAADLVAAWKELKAGEGTE